VLSSYFWHLELTYNWSEWLCCLTTPYLTKPPYSPPTLLKISAAIITKNEERNIGRCIDSLKGIASEIVVVDSFSTDGTRSICERAGVRFIEHPFEGHIQQKNFALDQCQNDWVLSLDADEALSEELRSSLLMLNESPEISGYSMSRLTNYCGKWVYHCGWYPDTKVRLVKRTYARWTGVNPHDRLDLTNGSEAASLNGNILHYSYYSREDHLRQIEYFSEIASRELFVIGRRTSWIMIVLKVVAQFIKTYIIKLGFLDGRTGWIIAQLSAYATYRKYYKLKKRSDR
jgi:glycosyltransferase involved in cell wall biosynthesis